MSFLTPCHDCNRHVLASDRDCPFCGAVVTDAMRARVPRSPQGRLGRAALMAFSATVATTACGGSEDSSDTRQPASGNTTGPSGPAQPTPATPNGMSGMPNMPGSGGAPATPIDEPMVSAEYGVAILPPEPIGPAGVGGSGNVPGSPVAGGGMSNAGAPTVPMLEPEPTEVPVYGAPVLEPVPEPSPNGTAGAPPMETPDAGVGEADAGSTDAGLVDPVPEPEPNVFPAYGITPDFE